MFLPPHCRPLQNTVLRNKRSPITISRTDLRYEVRHAHPFAELRYHICVGMLPVPQMRPVTHCTKLGAYSLATHISAGDIYRVRIRYMSLFSGIYALPL